MDRNFTLDAHGEKLLQQYRDRRHVFERLERLAYDSISPALRDITLNAIEHRIKEERSLAGKLELKGSKYRSLEDVTDIFGIRIITFYTDDVDKVAAIVKHTFDVDWENSNDKRKLHNLTSFGYNSLHYICRLPKSIVDDPEMPELNTYRFEVQMRTALQHVWSTIEHDIGYKGVTKLPPAYRRQFSRLSGMLELIDDEFSRLRTTLTDYNRRVLALVSSGKLDEVPLLPETFRSYLEMRPFDALNQRIAASNQAEIYPASLLPFLRVLQNMGLETLADVQKLISENEDDAYQFALSQLAITDLDIVSENVGLLNLCVVHVLKQGGGRAGLKAIYDQLNGYRPENQTMADMMMEQALELPFMGGAQQKKQ
jgi:ppGpp synthetase/RelA/SpoT-type nucleotidyltranferase